MLTPKQKAVLDFIQAFVNEKGYAPSQQEIAKHFGFSSLGTVQNYLVRLERHGLLRKTWNGKRSTEIVKSPSVGALRASPAYQADFAHPVRDAGEAAKGVQGTVTKLKPRTVLPAVPSPLVATLPVLGRVAAGRPIEYVEPDQEVDVPVSMFGGRTDLDATEAGLDHFVLRVSGNSMIEDGILDGDYVVIHKQTAADNGQTVVAMIGNEATIKRYYRKSRKIELHPANPAYEPIVLDSLTETRDFRIEGVLVGVIRKLA